jgi:hypothetical protein
MKNERAAIMALTFCIGFTTALIAYGLPIKDIPMTVVVPATSNTANLSATQSSGQRNTANAEQPDAQGYAKLDEDGLYLVNSVGTFLVSVDQLTAPNIPEAHAAIHMPIVDPSGTYLFYCAQMKTDHDHCTPRIFDSVNNVIHSVRGGSMSNTISLEAVPAAWTSTGLLVFGDTISTTAATPWILE